MLVKRSIQEEFLYRFTEEVIGIVKKQAIKKRLDEKELARIKREVEVEKLKQRFSSYGHQEKVQESKKVEAPKIEEKTKIIVHTQQIPIQIPRPIIKPQTIEISEKPKVQEVKQETNKEIKIETNIQQKVKKTEVKITPIKIPQQTPLKEGEIDLGKILFLIRDPLVTYIECPGIGKNIVARRAGATMRTQITLSKEEIGTIIKNFSDAARIPLIEGMLNARIDNLEMSAVVSEISDNSFIIKRNIIPPINKVSTQLQKPMMQFPKNPNINQEKNNTMMPSINRPFSQ